MNVDQKGDRLNVLYSLVKQTPFNRSQQIGSMAERQFANQMCRGSRSSGAAIRMDLPSSAQSSQLHILRAFQWTH